MDLEIHRILDELKSEDAEQLKKRIIQRIENKLKSSKTPMERIKAEIEILLPDDNT